MAEADFDVAIVGYGPVGQGLAAMLGQKGYRVCVFERWPGLYPLPRACVVDHEIMRTLQSIGVADEFSKFAVPTAGEYVWLNAAGKTLYHFKYNKDGISGWPARNLIYQPDLERLLDERVKQLSTVEVNQGWEVVGYSSGSSHDELVVGPCRLDSQGQIERGSQTRKVTARFVVGADGANSFVRQAAGLDWTDLGFRADWLVVDYRPNDPESELDMPEAGQICDAARPITLMRRMGRKHVRWEMMLLPGETAEEVTAPEKVWSLIDRWVKPGDGAIDRAAVYTFRSGIANKWFKGNAILAGDSAHLMPPFLGQGLCSGMRDALSLSWRLDLILRGVASKEILQSYEEERKQHVGTLIERAVALGKVVCITDPVEAAKRDDAILSGKAPPIPAFPQLTCGLLARAEGGALLEPAGQLSFQGVVSSDGEELRLDDVTGSGWRLIALDAGAKESLSDAHLAFAEKIGLKFITLDRHSRLVDVNDAHRTFMSQWDAKGLLVRPDFYIFSVARSIEDFGRIFDDLQQQLTNEHLADVNIPQQPELSKETGYKS
jgi:2-polyprenyl-6-methoxyphenol hydroxylase-like FAD-dependent oxidoreductase